MRKTEKNSFSLLSLRELSLEKIATFIKPENLATSDTYWNIDFQIFTFFLKNFITVHTHYTLLKMKAKVTTDNTYNLIHSRRKD